MKKEIEPKIICDLCWIECIDKWKDYKDGYFRVPHRQDWRQEWIVNHAIKNVLFAFIHSRRVYFGEYLLWEPRAIDYCIDCAEAISNAVQKRIDIVKTSTS